MSAEKYDILNFRNSTKRFTTTHQKSRVDHISFSVCNVTSHIIFLVLISCQIYISEFCRKLVNMIRRVKYFEIQPESHRPTSMVWLCRWKSFFPCVSSHVFGENMRFGGLFCCKTVGFLRLLGTCQETFCY